MNAGGLTGNTCADSLEIANNRRHGLKLQVLLMRRRIKRARAKDGQRSAGMGDDERMCLLGVMLGLVVQRSGQDGCAWESVQREKTENLAHHSTLQPPSPRRPQSQQAALFISGRSVYCNIFMSIAERPGKSKPQSA